ncbi:MAG: tyrosine-type recombinase/integrase [Bacteroidales bacterium]|nr:tyrosine-type recombinase/integrase [Bacteroidales bacterium]
MNKRPEYSFNNEIMIRLKGFKSYLKDLGNGENTIRQKSNYAGYYLKWLAEEGLQVEDASYNDLLNFIDYCKLESDSNTHINRKLSSIRDYYEYLKTHDQLIINPATNLYLKGSCHKIISGIINFKELESLYQDYPTITLRQKRNRVILGLLIYQGVTTDDLKRLDTGDVRLKEGKIHVPGDRRRNSRNLELRPFQVMELHDYLTVTRPAIIKGINQPGPARKPDRINKTRIESQLFISINGSENIKNSLWHLFREIKKINPCIINAIKIRQSVITYWLKTMNLRQVQYMAGHKRVSSTERYLGSNLESLKNKLEKCHPLNNKLGIAKCDTQF